jgi:hypothetical protein
MPDIETNRTVKILPLVELHSRGRLGRRWEEGSLHRVITLLNKKITDCKIENYRVKLEEITRGEHSN